MSSFSAQLPRDLVASIGSFLPNPRAVNETCKTDAASNAAQRALELWQGDLSKMPQASLTNRCLEAVSQSDLETVQNLEALPFCSSASIARPNKAELARKMSVEEIKLCLPLLIEKDWKELARAGIHKNSDFNGLSFQQINEMGEIILFREAHLLLNFCKALLSGYEIREDQLEQPARVVGEALKELLSLRQNPIDKAEIIRLRFANDVDLRTAMRSCRFGFDQLTIMYPPEVAYFGEIEDLPFSVCAKYNNYKALSKMLERARTNNEMLEKALLWTMDGTQEQMHGELVAKLYENFIRNNHSKVLFFKILDTALKTKNSVLVKSLVQTMKNELRDYLPTSYEEFYTIILPIISAIKQGNPILAHQLLQIVERAPPPSGPSDPILHLFVFTLWSQFPHIANRVFNLCLKCANGKEYIQLLPKLNKWAKRAAASIKCSESAKEFYNFFTVLSLCFISDNFARIRGPDLGPGPQGVDKHAIILARLIILALNAGLNQLAERIYGISSEISDEAKDGIWTTLRADVRAFKLSDRYPHPIYQFLAKHIPVNSSIQERLKLYAEQSLASTYYQASTAGKAAYSVLTTKEVKTALAITLVIMSFSFGYFQGLKARHAREDSTFFT